MLLTARTERIDFLKVLSATRREVRILLEALWRAWEHLRLHPATGISVWFRDHADHHMTVGTTG